MASRHSESKALRPRLPRPVSVWLGHSLPLCISCVFLGCRWLARVAGSHPTWDALCQVFILLQQLWCPHPSLLPPWAHTAWVPWTWGLCLAASTPLVHVEPWWGGDWKRKTSKAHVSGMVANAVWRKHVGRLGSLVHTGLWEECTEPTHQADAKQFQLSAKDH